MARATRPPPHAPRGRLPARSRRAAALAGAALLCACQAERALVVTSEPPGAEVRLDGGAVGRTPVRIPFLHYGTRRVTLYREGYLSRSEVVELSPPWYGRFPIDLFTEVLFPVGWEDVRELHMVLEPGQSTIAAPDLRSVLERAESLRRAGPEGPLPVPPPPAAEEGAARP